MTETSRVLIYDIETSSLNPYRGRLLSCTFIWLDEDKPFSVIPRLEDELTPLLAIKWRLEKAPAIAGFSSIRFDMNFINKRLDMFGYEPINQPNHFDVQKMFVKKYGGTDRISLEKVSERLGTADERAFKTSYDSATWQDAASGDQDALQSIVSHAESDVILTKRNYLALVGADS